MDNLKCWNCHQSLPTAKVTVCSDPCNVEYTASEVVMLKRKQAIESGDALLYMSSYMDELKERNLTKQ